MYSTNHSPHHSDFLKFILTLAIALFVNVVYWFLVLETSIGDVALTYFPSPAISTYLLSVVLFFVVFILLWKLIYRYICVDRLLSFLNKQVLLILVFGIVIIVVMFFFLYTNELNSPLVNLQPHLYYHNLPNVIVFSLLLLLFGVFFNLAMNVNARPSSLEAFTYVFFVAALVIAVGYAQFTPNIWTSFGALLHIDAYYTSIYNALFRTPFSNQVTGIYGHYGILLSVPLMALRWLGVTDLMLAFNVLISLGSVVVLLCNAYIIHSFVKNWAIKYPATLCSVCLHILFVRYWQLIPHRQLPIAIIAAYITFLHKRKATIPLVVIGYGMCAILLVWSTDFGLVALFSYCIYLLMLLLQRHELKEWKLWLCSLLHILLSVLSVAFAIMIVNVYNVVHGGSFIGVQTFFKATADERFIDSLRVPPPSYLSAWMLVLGMAFVTMGGSALSISFLSKYFRTRQDYAALFSFAMLAIGSMIYYMNRAIWGHHQGGYMIYFIILAIIGEHTIEHARMMVKERAKSFFYGINSIICLAVLLALFSLSMATISSFGFTMTRTANHRDMEVRADIKERVKEVIPANTIAWGYGMTQLYSMLGWNTNFFTTEYANVTITTASRDYFIDKLRSVDGKPFVTTSVSIARLETIDADLYKLLRENYLIYEEIFFMNPNHYIQFFVPLRYELGTLLDFSQFTPYVLTGWSLPESWGRWTDGYEVELAMRIDVDNDVVMHFHIQHLVVQEPVNVYINNRFHGAHTLGLGENELFIPKESVDDGWLHIRFVVSDPHDVEGERQLGFGISELWIAEK